MKVVVFGATGMVGQGVLRECLLDPGVTQVLTVGRTAIGQEHPKLREVVPKDLTDLSPVENDLAGADACFFCLGVPSAGMSESDYRAITYDITMAAAELLARLNPELTFIYISGAGTGGRSMWARVKGETENALLTLPFHGYALRPGYIQPRHSARSKVRAYAIFYTLMTPLYPVLKALFPRSILTTEQVGRAMLAIARQGAAKRILETGDIVDVIS
jgi:uncharacterized protein YbjT (DUF2867 family)